MDKNVRTSQELGFCSTKSRPNNSANARRFHLWSSILSCCVRRKENATHKLGILVVLKGDLLQYSFRLTSAFSAPFWIIYLVGTKMLKIINLSYGLNSLLFILVDSLDVECLGFHSCPLRLFSFFRGRFALFCFFFKKKKHIGSLLQHQFIRK